jgi:hypothetical protein
MAWMEGGHDASLGRWLDDNDIRDDNAEITFRFNSSNPYLSVRITDPVTETLFRLRWAEGSLTEPPPSVQHKMQSEDV